MATQQKGKISTWKDDKGFGFIRPDDGGKEIFFHVSSLANRRTRPLENIAVTYTLTYDDQLRPRAINIQLGYQSTPPVVIFTLYIIGVFFIALAFVTFMFNISLLLLVVYIMVSCFTFMAYNLDKTSAVKGERRIPEFSLHFLELLGGWPGALVAQWYYRHKNRKISYQVAYWIIVMINLGVLLWYCIIAGYRQH